MSKVVQNQLRFLISWVVSTQDRCRVLIRYEMHAFYFHSRLEQIVNIFIRSEKFTIYFVGELLKVQGRKIDHEKRQIYALFQFILWAIFDDIIECSSNHG